MRRLLLMIGLLVMAWTARADFDATALGLGIAAPQTSTLITYALNGVTPTVVSDAIDTSSYSKVEVHVSGTAGAAVQVQWCGWSDTVTAQNWNTDPFWGSNGTAGVGDWGVVKKGRWMRFVAAKKGLFNNPTVYCGYILNQASQEVIVSGVSLTVTVTNVALNAGSNHIGSVSLDASTNTVGVVGIKAGQTVGLDAGANTIGTVAIQAGQSLKLDAGTNTVGSFSMTSNTQLGSIISGQGLSNGYLSGINTNTANSAASEASNNSALADLSTTATSINSKVATSNSLLGSLTYTAGNNYVYCDGAFVPQREISHTTRLTGVTGVGPFTIATPASGKKIILMATCGRITGNSTISGGGVLTASLWDGSTTITTGSAYVGSTVNNTTASNSEIIDRYKSYWGNGRVCAVNSPITMTLSNALTNGQFDLYIGWTEE